MDPQNQPEENQNQNQDLLDRLTEEPWGDRHKAAIFVVILLAFVGLAGVLISFASSDPEGSVQEEEMSQTAQNEDEEEQPQVEPVAPLTNQNAAFESGVCSGTDLTNVPESYRKALEKYANTNSEAFVAVCTEDEDGDDEVDWIVIETTNQPEHESVYYPDGHVHHEDYDYQTNIHKFEELHKNQEAHSAGPNMIESQTITMRIPVAPREANNKTASELGTIGIALNGVSFFNEQAGPGMEITDELFTFDQCSGHPQQQGVYHYHIDPTCLIRDLGGGTVDKSKIAGGTTYRWIEDNGENANLLLGFLMDGFPVYGPIGNGEVDCNGNAVATINQYNGHTHCTEDFENPIFHYHVRTAALGAEDDPVFWIVNSLYFGVPGSVSGG